MMKLGEIRDTGNRRFPKAWLTKDPKRGYVVMLLSWDPEADMGNGWFYAYNGDLKGARKYARGWTEGK